MNKVKTPVTEIKPGYWSMWLQSVTKCGSVRREFQKLCCGSHCLSWYSHFLWKALLQSAFSSVNT